MVRNDTIQKFLDDAASDGATPGGGSAAALAGALGAAIASMCAALTTGGKQLDGVEGKLAAARDCFERSRSVLGELVEEDIVASGKVMSAVRMAQSTDDEKTVRSAALRKAVAGAMEVPMRAMRAAMEVLRDLGGIVGEVNRNAIGDAGVAAILCEAAVRASKLNVEINLAFLKKGVNREEVLSAVSQGVEAAARVAREIVDKVEASIRS